MLLLENDGLKTTSLLYSICVQLRSQGHYKDYEPKIISPKFMCCTRKSS